MASKCSCPKCRAAVAITQPLPAQVQCAACKTKFKVSKPNSKAVQVARPAPLPGRPLADLPPAEIDVDGPSQEARNRNLILVLVGGGAFVLGGILILVVLLNSGKKEPAKEQEVAQNFAPFDIPEPKLPIKPVDPRQQKIDRAIAKGVTYLKQRLQENNPLVYFINDKGGAHLGAVALTGLTLLECGHDAKDPAVQKAAALVRQGAPRVTFTYGIALCMLFLNRLHPAPDWDPAGGGPPAGGEDDVDLSLINSLTLRLIAGQQKEGGWGYHCMALDPSLENQLRERIDSGGFRPGNFNVPGQYHSPADNSIGQFATLALWAVRKRTSVTSVTLRESAAHYRRTQLPEGNWSYRPQSPFMKDTATCAGLIALAVQYGMEDERPEPKVGVPSEAKKENTPGEAPKKTSDPAQDPLARKALAHLEKVVGKKAEVPEKTRETRMQHNQDFERLLKAFESTPNGPQKQNVLNDLIKLDRPDFLLGTIFEADAWGDLYFLWSLERMAVIYDLKTIGSKDWYQWGVDIILASQKGEGNWHDRFPGVPDTCFALLFLRRANLAKDLTDKFRLLRGEVVGNAPPNAPGARDTTGETIMNQLAATRSGVRAPRSAARRG